MAMVAEISIRPMRAVNAVVPAAVDATLEFLSSCDEMSAAPRFTVLVRETQSQNIISNSGLQI
jgi:hypothetical protein